MLKQEPTSRGVGILGLQAGEEVKTAVLLALIGLIWSMAHITVARECDKLGAFYVGDQVFECKR